MIQPRRGAASSSSSRALNANVAQRKFSMLFSSITQRSFADHASEPLVRFCASISLFNET
jgi:hypothetical protein